MSEALKGTHKTEVIRKINLKYYETPDGDFFNRHDPKPLRITFQDTQETHEENR